MNDLDHACFILVHQIRVDLLHVERQGLGVDFSVFITAVAKDFVDFEHAVQIKVVRAEVKLVETSTREQLSLEGVGSPVWLVIFALTSLSTSFLLALPEQFLRAHVLKQGFFGAIFVKNNDAFGDDVEDALELKLLVPVRVLQQKQRRLRLVVEELRDFDDENHQQAH